MGYRIKNEGGQQSKKATGEIKLKTQQKHQSCGVATLKNTEKKTPSPLTPKTCIKRTGSSQQLHTPPHRRARN